jgi:hypothetical protein
MIQLKKHAQQALFVGQAIWMALTAFGMGIIMVAIVAFVAMPVGHVVFKYWSEVVAAYTPAKTVAKR